MADGAHSRRGWLCFLLWHSPMTHSQACHPSRRCLFYLPAFFSPGFLLVPDFPTLWGGAIFWLPVGVTASAPHRTGQPLPSEAIATASFPEVSSETLGPKARSRFRLRFYILSRRLVPTYFHIFRRPLHQQFFSISLFNYQRHQYHHRRKYGGFFFFFPHGHSDDTTFFGLISPLGGKMEMDQALLHFHVNGKTGIFPSTF